MNESTKYQVTQMPNLSTFSRVIRLIPLFNVDTLLEGIYATLKQKLNHTAAWGVVCSSWCSTRFTDKKTFI